jgi:hypothetical protein
VSDIDQLYRKADLADHADLSRIDRSVGSHWPPNRSDLLREALDTNVEGVCSGGYQGTWVFILVVDDILWLLKDSYGSCSYCDGLLAAADLDGRSYRTDEEELGAENVRQYAESMMNNAYAFESKNDAVRFIARVDGYGWRDVRSDTIETLDEVDY